MASILDKESIALLKQSILGEPTEDEVQQVIKWAEKILLHSQVLNLVMERFINIIPGNPLRFQGTSLANTLGVVLNEKIQAFGDPDGEDTEDDQDPK